MDAIQATQVEHGQLRLANIPSLLALSISDEDGATLPVSL